MTPRRLLTTIGATALGFGIVVGGAATIPGAYAQETTPAVEAPAQTDVAIDREARVAEAYDSFVAALASELGEDEAAVDDAIRSALKEQVAARESDGQLDADQVADLQAMIDEAEAPLFFGMGGFGGPGKMHRFVGRDGGFEGHGPRGAFHERGPRGVFDEPATLPSDAAAGQSAPVAATPAESGISS